MPSGQAGKYNFTAQILLYDSNAQLMGIRPMFYKNGTMISEAIWEKEANASSIFFYNYSSNINITLNLSASDYIEVFVRGNTKDNGGFIMDGDSSDLYSYFTGYKIIE